MIQTLNNAFKVLDQIKTAESKEDLATVCQEIRNLSPEDRGFLWPYYYDKKDEIKDLDENGAFRDIQELKALNWDDFLFGGHSLSREEEFELAYEPDFNEILREEEKKEKISIRTQLFHHTMKQLRKSAVKEKNYQKFSFIIQWVYKHKNFYNPWDLKHVFRTHREIKNLCFSCFVKKA